MAVEIAARSDDGFTIGGTLGDSLAVLGRNLPAFAAIAVLTGLPLILFIVGGAPTAGLAEAIETRTRPPHYWEIVAIRWALTLLTGVLIQAGVVHGTLQDLRGKPVRFADCVGRGLAALPRAMLPALVALVAFSAGLAVLLVPGLMLMAAWWVFVPVAVVERGGAIACFRRSAALTKGRRWRIFGLTAILTALDLGLGRVLMILDPVFGISGLALITGGVTLILYAFSGVTMTVGYCRLRAEQEGVGVERIAAALA